MFRRKINKTKKNTYTRAVTDMQHLPLASNPRLQHLSRAIQRSELREMHIVCEEVNLRSSVCSMREAKLQIFPKRADLMLSAQVHIRGWNRNETDLDQK